MPYKSNRRELENRFKDAVAAGTTAAARRYANAVQRRLSRGYTTGKYKTGTVASEVVTIPATRHVWTAYVGTNALAKVDYALYWELGHFNYFILAYVRVPIWRPYLRDTVPQQEAGFRIAFERIFYGRPGRAA